MTWNIADNDVAIINTSTLAVSYVPRLMTMVMALGVAPDGRLLAVGTELKNEIRFEPNVKSIFVRTTLASFAQATPSSVSIADLNPQLDYQSRSWHLKCAHRRSVIRAASRCIRRMASCTSRAWARTI